MKSYGPLFGLCSGRRKGHHNSCPMFGRVPTDFVHSQEGYNPWLTAPYTGGDGEPTDYKVIGTGAMLSGIIIWSSALLYLEFSLPDGYRTFLWRLASVLSIGVLVLHPMAHTIKCLLLNVFLTYRGPSYRRLLYLSRGPHVLRHAGRHSLKTVSHG